MLACVSPIFAQYGGPAILVRGQSPSAMAASQIDFRPFLSLNATYNSGLGGVSIDAQGNPVTDFSAGLQVSAGVSGLHSWKHTHVGLDYRASLQHFVRTSFFDSTTQSLMLGVDHLLSRHVNLSLHTGAGIYSGYNTGSTLLSTVPFDPSTLYQPTNEFFDNRTIFVSSQANLSIQRSTRLSYNVGAEGFLTRRRSTALYGVAGAGARGDVQYRITRRSTIGAGYNYSHFAFHGIFSSTDIHALNLSYGVTLTKSTEFSAFAGAARYETKFVQSVAVDPAIAALIGISATQRVAYGRSITPSYSARLSRAVRKGVVFVSGGRSITPGNGLFLTSVSNTASVGYSYSGLRKWALSTGASYVSSDSVGNVIGRYSYYTGNLSASRQIVPHTHGVLSFSSSHADSRDFKNYNRWQYAVNLGLTFAPGDVPVRFW
jgi:hypothetical protein